MGTSLPHGLVIAIDGPSGSGKSSASRGVARSLGLRYLDTGAMYRALTWWFMTQEKEVGDAELVAAQAAEPVIEVSTDPAAPWTRVNGRDVSAEIRTPEVSAQVSVVARVPRVRAHLIAMQRAIIAAAEPGIVTEGRDIGTVVAADAQLKVFLTADPVARARRRAAEFAAVVDEPVVDEPAVDEPAVDEPVRDDVAVNDADVDDTVVNDTVVNDTVVDDTVVNETVAAQARRDRLDAAQSEKAADARLIDATDLTLDQVIEEITRLARESSQLAGAGEKSS